jgi:2-oxoglutarate ferredoxin oxidoreductase subunit beta
VQGEPLVFGSPGNLKGVVMIGGDPSVIDLADDDDPIEKGIVVHDEFLDSTAYAFALATLSRPDFPLPVGVLRESTKEPYEQMLSAQIDDAIATKGPGDLEALLNSGDTWTVGTN